MCGNKKRKLTRKEKLEVLLNEIEELIKYVLEWEENYKEKGL